MMGMGSGPPEAIPQVNLIIMMIVMMMMMMIMVKMVIMTGCSHFRMGSYDSIVQGGFFSLVLVNLG